MYVYRIRISLWHFILYLQFLELFNNFPVVVFFLIYLIHFTPFHDLFILFYFYCHFSSHIFAAVLPDGGPGNTAARSRARLPSWGPLCPRGVGGALPLGIGDPSASAGSALVCPGLSGLVWVSAPAPPLAVGRDASLHGGLSSPCP